MTVPPGRKSEFHRRHADVFRLRTSPHTKVDSFWESISRVERFARVAHDAGKSTAVGTMASFLKRPQDERSAHMAKKDKEEAKKAEGAAPAPDTPEAAGKKRKILLLAGIGGLLTVALAGGGFFAYKTFLGGKKDHVAMSAKNEKSENSDSKGDAKSEKSEGDPKSEAKSDSKADTNEKAKSSGKEEATSDGKSVEKDAQKVEEKSDAKAGEKDGKKDEGKGDEKKEGKEEEHSKAGDKAKKDTREKSAGFGETIDLPKMDLNLGNPLENRFLRMGITIEYHGGESQKEEIKRREPQLKDIVITSISSKSRLELLTEKGKERLRKELTNRFNEVLDRPVKSLFFTDFLVE
jgi:flagellar FliL protein